MDKRKNEKRKGVLTVEALIILPIFYVVFIFIISILSLSYQHLVMQQALNNTGRTLAQYGHLINQFVDLKKFGLTEEVNEKEEKIESDVKDISSNFSGLKTNISALATDFTGATDESGNTTKQGLISLFSSDFFNNLPTIETRFEEIEGHFEAVSGSLDGLKKGLSDFGNDVKSIKKDEVFNYLIGSFVEIGGGGLLQFLIGDYLNVAGTATEDEESGNGIFRNLKYRLFVDANTADFILVAEYDYDLPFSLIGDYHIQQSVRVHPWIGGNHTEGLPK